MRDPADVHRPVRELPLSAADAFLAKIYDKRLATAYTILRE
jgi:hypothetical protein